jgi:hypothetical protein
MLKTTYILRLGQLLKIALDFKKYMWQKLMPEKPQNKIKFTQTKTSLIPPQNAKSKYDQTFRNH